MSRSAPVTNPFGAPPVPAGEVDPMAPDLLADPYTGYGRLRERAPLLRGRYLDGTAAWYVTRQADVRTVLSDPRFANDVSSVPGAEDRRAQMTAALGVPPEYARYFDRTIINSDPPDHTRLRRLVSRAFTVRRIAALRPRVEAITAGLLDDLAGSVTAPVDLLETFAYPLPITVICELVGVDEADRPAWRESGRALISLDRERIGPAIRAMVERVHGVIERRRAEPADDLLSVLVRTHDDDGDRLSDVELVTMVLSLVFAGHETTAHLIGNATVALLTHPDQLAVLRADPGLWPGAVNELMRWTGPALMAQIRYATADLELGGVTVRRGDAVEAVLVSANFDPRVYDEPDRLDVTRLIDAHGDGHVGFGHGIHYCLGAALARQEVEVALHALFDRFPGLALAVDPAELAWSRMPGARRLLSLPVHLR
jgi:cytochrome P450